MDGEAITIVCADSTRLRGHLWKPDGLAHGTVLLNPATGVLARYYHFYACYLAENGFAAITYDYRGIGLSRPPRLRGSGITWRDWGERDCEAAIIFAKDRDPGGSLSIVGHSIGGFLIGFAPSAPRVDRILTVGAQYAYWPDYAARRRMRLVMRWHVAMPVLTALFGYFPGRRLGWLEDLPAAVAREWSFRRARMELNYPAADRSTILERFTAVRAPILALSTTDDDFATIPAMTRALAYFTGCQRHIVMLEPANLSQASIGHFALFHTRFRGNFWPATLAWLRDGRNPWSSSAKTLPRGKDAGEY